MVRIDPKTGLRAMPGSGGPSILEAFKPGSAPAYGDDVPNAADPEAPPAADLQSNADVAIMRPGTGSLY
jgi:penicillin-binding protein 1A